MYGLLIIITSIITITGIYTLFTLGSEVSLMRLIISNQAADFYIVIISSICVFICGFILFHLKDRQNFCRIVQLNAERIKQLRKQGKTDIEIAESILHAMGSTKGYKHNFALKKLATYIDSNISACQ